MNRAETARASVDVAVVGAGLAGLAAARDVRRASLDLVVLEARDRVGGRVLNHSIGGGAVVEVGGQWIGPTQDRIAAMAAEVGVETFETYGVGGNRISIGGRSDYQPQVTYEVFGEWDAMARELPLEAPWTATKAREWDTQTVETWLRGRVGDPTELDLLRLVVATVLTAEADEVSLLHLLVYIRSAGSLQLLTQVAGGAQERRFVGGSQLVASRLAERLGADRVRLGEPVRRIRQTGDEVLVETDGMHVAARRVIVTVPITLADRILYDPPLPADRAQMFRRFAPGATTKVHFVYQKPFWRDDGLSGRVLTDEGPVTATFDNSPPGGTPGVLVGFVEADHARRFAGLAAEDRREAALRCVVRHFGPRAAHPLEYFEMDWSAEEWTRGCFGSNLPPGAWTRYGSILREPFGRIHWAGAETSAIWMNYMDGAVRSGERAAAEVVRALAS